MFDKVREPVDQAVITCRIHNNMHSTDKNMHLQGITRIKSVVNDKLVLALYIHCHEIESTGCPKKITVPFARYYHNQVVNIKAVLTLHIHCHEMEGTGCPKP